MKHLSSMSLYLSDSYSLSDPKVSIIIPATILSIMMTSNRLYELSNSTLPQLNLVVTPSSWYDVN